MIDDFKPVKLIKRSKKFNSQGLSSDTPAPFVSSEFRTPEQVAQESPEPTTTPTPQSVAAPAPAVGRWAALRQWRPTRKQWIICAVIGVVLISGGTTFALTRSKPTTTPKPVVATVTPKAKPAAPVLVSTLTGMPISDASVNSRPVTGVMIENSDGARPQSGLDQAGVVFEALAEGGITRFLALFQDTAPGYIGPIRSARPYYLQWCLGFDCSLAHVGGSPDALSDITAWNVKNLDEFANGGSYHRIASREAPHNVYTSMADLNALEAQKGYGASSYTGFIRKPDSPSKSPNATIIDINPASADFASHYTYNASTNNYTRSEAGAVQTELDAAGNSTTITPKVVIALVMTKTQGALDATGAYYQDYVVIGSGQADIFEDGTSYTGTWTKTAPNSQITFTDANGKPIPLNAGQTWLTAVDSPSEVSSS